MTDNLEVNCQSLGYSEKEYLTLSDACLLSICNVKSGTLRAAINRGKLPARKFGNSWVVRCEDLLTYLKKRKVGRPKNNIDKL